MSNSSLVPSKRRGPVAAAGRVRVTLYLDEMLADWGKHQPGGLSEMVRRLLTEARSEADSPAGSDSYPTTLRIAYQRLVTQKLRSGLTPEEDRQLTQIREQINAIDRTTLAWHEHERAAGIIDQELAELRREIEALPEQATAVADK